MATLRLAYLVLNDSWPGAVNPNLSIPTDGWDNTVDNFITTVAGQTGSYPIGTKIMAYNDNTHNPGYYTCQYLKYHDFSAVDISKEDFSKSTAWVSHNDGSTAENYEIDTSSVPWYVVAGCYTAIAADITKGMPVALPCASLGSDGTGVYVATFGDAYGWFWVGGVAPLADVSLFRGALDHTEGFDFTVDSLLRRGPAMFCTSGATATMHLMSPDVTNLTDATGIVGDTPQALAYVCVSAS